VTVPAPPPVTGSGSDPTTCGRHHGAGRCGKPVGTHGVTLHHEGVAVGRQPICDDCYDDLRGILPRTPD
jgi:hypothetical protein